jgi:mono/diheme cytochrome c family protein
MRQSSLLILVLTTASTIGCGDDDSPDRPDSGADGGMDAGPADGGGSAKDGGLDATTQPLLDSSIHDTGTSGSNEPLIARGRYITTVLYPCGSCHTPRDAGVADLSKLFSGIDCWTDTVPADGGVGCLSSKNLTNHPTGIKNLSDNEVKDLFLRGLQPDGKALHPQMPYAVLGNMNDDDANAVVAYLRSLPPIEHMVAPNQPPFNTPPDAPAPRWPESDIPRPRPEYTNQAAALRGRYLAGNIGNCLDCHTTRDPVTNTPVTSKTFQGGRTFGNNPTAWAPNITPADTGIKTYTVEDVLRALKFGEDADQGYSKFCGPMPAGPTGAYGGLTDDDARDIGHYLLSIPPVEHMVGGDCQPGVTDAGVRDAG